MRLLTYGLDNQTKLGVLRGDGIVDLSAHFDSMLAFIDSGMDALRFADTLLLEAPAAHLLSDVTIQSPIPRPRRDLWAVGWNYLKHFQEGVGCRDDSPANIPEHPTFFRKSALTVVGPGDSIAYDGALSTHMDYEGELAVIIGRPGRSIPRDRALGHVFGYAVANDITARDIQRRHGGQWTKGKSIDGTCPLGPWIVTAQEIPDPQALRVECHVNGEPRQSETTAAMAFSVADLIAELSEGMTLVSGDILLTGTPEGVGYPQDRWLNPGDEVITSVEGIGELRNRVAETSLMRYSRGAVDAGVEQGWNEIATMAPCCRMV